MNKKIAVIWVSLAMIFSLVVVLDVIIDLTPLVSGTTHYVNETGSGGVFMKIQDAINASKDGDTVFVYNGTYFERIVVNKTINLTGEDKNYTIINGGESLDVVNISANWVNVTNLTINGSGTVWGDAGIKLYEVHNCSIFNNNVSYNFMGLSLNEASNNFISSNIVTYNSPYGIYLVSSSSNTLKGNNISSTWSGIYLYEANNNTIINNSVSSNTGNGIYLITSFNNSIIYNHITGNVKGIQLEGSANSIVTDNNILFNTAYGISLSSSSNSIIKDNNISDNGGGIYLGYSIYINLTGNNFTNEGIFMKGSQVEQYNTHEIDISNIVNGKPVYYWKNQTGGTIPPGAGQVILANCTNVKIEDQELNRCTVGIELGFSSHNEINSNNASFTKYGMWVAYSDRNNIMNNNISNNDWMGIFLAQSSWNNVTGNNVSLSKDDGIILSGSDNNTITLNNVFLIDRYAVYVVMSSNNIIKHNNVSGNNWDGIRLDYSFNNSVTSNNVTSNLNYGIILDMSSYNNITNNNILKNIENGIYLYSNSNHNRLEANNIQLNNWGIYLRFSSNNSILQNNVAHNDLGIYLASSLNNTITTNNVLLNNVYGFYLSNSLNNRIYHNNLIDNVNQAYDNHDSNLWNQTYPSGGNYWSDYNGIDLNSSPNQDVPPPDGIGDTPYVIDADSQDNYPLMIPFGNCIFLYKGWNLISIPMIQKDQGLITVLEMIDGYYDAVQWYDSSDSQDPWEHHKVGKPFGNDLSKINETMGFWIHITQPGDTIFLYNGTQPTSNQTIQLHPGWNLVGYPSLTTYNRTEGLNNLTFGTHVDALWTYNATTQKWKEIGPSDYFEIGKGYWVHAKTKCEWEVPL